MRANDVCRAWVVYRTTLRGNAVCEQREWDAIEAARPGSHPVLDTGPNTGTGGGEPGPRHHGRRTGGGRANRSGDNDPSGLVIAQFPSRSPMRTINEGRPYSIALALHAHWPPGMSLKLSASFPPSISGGTSSSMTSARCGPNAVTLVRCQGMWLQSRAPSRTVARIGWVIAVGEAGTAVSFGGWRFEGWVNWSIRCSLFSQPSAKRGGRTKWGNVLADIRALERSGRP